MAKRAERHPWDRVKRSLEVVRPEVPPGSRRKQGPRRERPIQRGTYAKLGH
jgi:hypothetical protein